MHIVGRRRLALRHYQGLHAATFEEEVVSVMRALNRAVTSWDVSPRAHAHDLLREPPDCLPPADCAPARLSPRLAAARDDDGDRTSLRGSDQRGQRGQQARSSPVAGAASSVPHGRSITTGRVDLDVSPPAHAHAPELLPGDADAGLLPGAARDEPRARGSRRQSMAEGERMDWRAAPKEGEESLAWESEGRTGGDATKPVTEWRSGKGGALSVYVDDDVAPGGADFGGGRGDGASGPVRVDIEEKRDGGAAGCLTVTIRTKGKDEVGIEKDVDARDCVGEARSPLADLSRNAVLEEAEERSGTRTPGKTPRGRQAWGGEEWRGARGKGIGERRDEWKGRGEGR